jgi:hypothetical protein
LQMAWREDAIKVIVLLGDAEPHDYRDDPWDRYPRAVGGGGRWRRTDPHDIGKRHAGTGLGGVARDGPGHRWAVCVSDVRRQPIG